MDIRGQLFRDPFHVACAIKVGIVVSIEIGSVAIVKSLAEFRSKAFTVDLIHVGPSKANSVGKLETTNSGIDLRAEVEHPGRTRNYAPFSFETRHNPEHKLLSSNCQASIDLGDDCCQLISSDLRPTFEPIEESQRPSNFCGDESTDPSDCACQRRAC
jgi:hypothetical protein